MELFHFKRPEPGSSPGTVLALPERHATPASLYLADYDQRNFEEHYNLTLESASPFFTSARATWLHIQGDPEPELVYAIGSAYDLHPLAVADVINGGQRTKVENYPNQHFIVLRRPVLEEDVLETHQVSLFLGRDYVVSFYPGPSDPFEAIRERLRNNPDGRLRKERCDYLLYALIDLVVDSSFPVLEVIGEQLETLEDSVLEHPTRDTLDQIHVMKRELILLRRAQWPQREVLNVLLRDDFSLIRPETRIYLRDCYDHTVQVLDLLENYREMSSSLLDVYLSSLSNRMNDVMKVLTVIATIFIPLSFLAGVYGMNFDTQAGRWNMPELGWQYGYLLFWLLALALVGGMLLLFRRKGWF